MTTTRKQAFARDMAVIKKVDALLDQKFYPVLLDKLSLDLEVKRVTNAELQKRGADVVLINKKKPKVVIDEKAQISCAGKPRPTFAFELLFYIDKHDKWINGWFVNDKQTTTHYLLVYFDEIEGKSAYDSNFKPLKSRCYLIDKKLLMKKLQQLGIDKDQLMDTVATMQAKNIDRVDLGNSLRIVWSRQLVEQPFNLVVPLNILRQATVFFQMI